MAYAAFEEHCGIAKPSHVYAVQRATEATYAAPLGWKDGATVKVTTLAATERGFDQQFEIVSAASGHRVAQFVHHWVWLDTQAGKRVALSEAVQSQLLAG
jgi:acyl-CoA thioesterase FadM